MVLHFSRQYAHHCTSHYYLSFSGFLLADDQQWFGGVFSWKIALKLKVDAFSFHQNLFTIFLFFFQKRDTARPLRGIESTSRAHHTACWLAHFTFGAFSISLSENDLAASNWLLVRSYTDSFRKRREHFRAMNKVTSGSFARIMLWCHEHRRCIHFLSPHNKAFELWSPMDCLVGRRECGNAWHRPWSNWTLLS